jgi:hypothetical protein
MKEACLTGFKTYLEKRLMAFKSSISAPDNHRYFQKLKEDELAANAS